MRRFRSMWGTVSAGAVAAVVGFVTIQPVQAQKVLFHGSGATAVNGDDAAVLAHLESVFGAANVTYISSPAAAADGSSALGFNAIVVSSTTDSGTLLKYADAPIGVLNWENALTRDDRPGEYFLSTGGGTTTGQTQINIVDPAHPLAAGLSGTVTVFNSPQNMSFGTGTLGAGVSLVASLTSNTANHSIMAADVGDALLGNGSLGSPATAPGRRVMFFLENAGFSDLTPEGIQLFDNALEFVAMSDPFPFLVAGNGTIGRVSIQAAAENVVTGSVTDPVGAAMVQVFDAANPGNLQAVRDIAANDVPFSEGVLPAPIFWPGSNGGQYPEVFGFDPGVNREGYTVRITGEMLIERNGEIIFKDGNDDFTSFHIDTDGDGTLDEVINDNTWTNEFGVNNGGSPISPATFTNVPSEGAWREFEFFMSEGTGGDSGALAWNFNDTNGSFPSSRGNAFGANNGDDLVPGSHLRAPGATVDDGTMSFDAVLRLADLADAFTFDVDVQQLEWDKIGMSIPAQIGEQTPGTATLDLDGVTINLNLTEDPVPGLTVDLIDNRGITEITGTPTFAFSHGDEADWDTSMFNVNGQLRFGGGPAPGIPGDYNGNGTVEQADLDLVLLNWGQPGVPGGWVNDLPDGNIDQAELDGVLLNWGNMAGLGSAAGVPEPSTFALLLAAAGLALCRGRIGKKLLAVFAVASLVGWSVQSAYAQVDVGGAGVIRKVSITGERQNIVEEPIPDNGLGFLFAERYSNPRPQFDTWVNVQNYIANNDPVASGVLEAPPIWDNDQLGNYPYPSVLGFPQSNQDNYGVRIFGEILIPEDGFIDFRDGIDDDTVFIVDEDGDGSLDNNEPIIQDTSWTSLNGTANGGGIGGTAPFFGIFDNVEPGGAWRKFELTMSEGGGGDRISLAWSIDDANGSFNPGIAGTATGGFALNEGDDLVPGDHFRAPGASNVLSFDSVLDFTSGANFEVIVEELEWDRVLSNKQLGTAEVNYIVDFSGGVLALELSSDPVPGMTVDLINDRDNVDEIRGPASFTFSHGDEALWDTSNFTTNGQISYAAGAAQVLAGDFNGNGRVEQADMDLVLLNWGQSGSDLPQGWIVSPPEGNIDQGELDAVLLNWGAGSGLTSTSGVPEPSTIALLVIAAAGLGLGRFRKR